MSSYYKRFSYNGVMTKADVSIIYASNNYSGRIKKPLIFVEGFDPRDLVQIYSL